MLEVIEAGLYTTVQDYPGRVGYWRVGVPPSGPMDAFALQAANTLVGNPETYAGLEITAIGPTLQFHDDALIALTGAELVADLDGEDVPWWETIPVQAGAVLTLKGLKAGGFRSYLAVAHGINVPVYLGSRSTFPDGHFGGLNGRILKKADRVVTFGAGLRDRPLLTLHEDDRPRYVDGMEVGAVLGPHEAPDFFTREYVDLFYDTEWRVSYASNRLGYRLEGPKPQYTREHGGEGGRHPSNIPDFGYAVGTINFTGDTPIILGVDGPSLGGFVCLVTIPTGEFWKVGQAVPGGKLRFKRITVAEAAQGLHDQRIILDLITNGRSSAAARELVAEPRR